MASSSWIGEAMVREQYLGRTYGCVIHYPVLRVKILADLVAAPVSFADISLRDRAFSPMAPRPA
jgi:hypothetical protein